MFLKVHMQNKYAFICLVTLERLRSPSSFHLPAACIFSKTHLFLLPILTSVYMLSVSLSLLPPLSLSHAHTHCTHNHRQVKELSSALHATNRNVRVRRTSVSSLGWSLLTITSGMKRQ